MWDSIPGPWDHALSQSRRSTTEPPGGPSPDISASFIRTISHDHNDRIGLLAPVRWSVASTSRKLRDWDTHFSWVGPSLAVMSSSCQGHRSCQVSILQCQLPLRSVAITTPSGPIRFSHQFPLTLCK